MQFEWDEWKNSENRLLHGISFEEVATLFTGEGYLEIYDEAHSDFEDRFIAIGPVLGRIVYVVWTEPEDDIVRIISARRASRRERLLYHSTMGWKS